MIKISSSVWNPAQVGTCTTVHQPQTLMVTSHTAEVLMLSMLGDIKLIMTKRKHFSQKNKQKMPPDQSMFSYYVPLFSCILFYFCNIYILLLNRNLPPSQGGKYAGFGNSAYTPQQSRPSGDVYDSLASVINVLLIFFLVL